MLFYFGQEAGKPNSIHKPNRKTKRVARCRMVRRIIRQVFSISSCISELNSTTEFSGMRCREFQYFDPVWFSLRRVAIF